MEREFFVWFMWNDFITPKKRKPPMVGLCTRTGRIAKLGGMLEALVIVDAYITDGCCEEAQRCLDLQCDLNKTTWASLCQGMGLRRIPKKPDNFKPGAGLNALEFSYLVEEAKSKRRPYYICQTKAGGC